jgi:golgi phosphoprotein 3
LELEQQQKIQLDEKHLVLKDSRLTGDFIYDFVIRFISHSQKTRTIEYWITHLGDKIKEVKEKLLEGLTDKGILEKVEGKILWIFPTQKYPTRYEKPEYILRKRIHDIVIGGKEPDVQSSMLLGLIQASDLIKEVFRNKEEYKAAKNRVKVLIEGDAMNKAVNKAVQAIQAAITASLVAITAATTVCTS